MSWFSVPLPNPFKALHFSDDDETNQTQPPDPDPESLQPLNDAVSPSTGIKDDFSAIGRQLRSVASFLSPPPAATESPSVNLAGIRSDLAEIGGTFKNSLSLLSTTKAVSEISNLTSNLFGLSEESENLNHDHDHQQRINDGEDDNGEDEDEDEDEGPGITDEVVEFASKISSRSELWADFPLPLDQEFDMSDAQSEHASIIEQLVPSLTDLRNTLSSHMSEKHFWMIYFILLLPRLNEDDFELLSTPEIIEARETLLLMLRSKNDTEITSENPEADGSSNVDSKVKDREMEKSQSVEKATISENLMASKTTEQVVADNSNSRMVKEEHENTDSWLEEEPSASGPSFNAPKRFQSEEDVSFSDLEDDDDDRPSQSRRASSAEESNEWVRLNQSKGQSSSRERESEGEESSDWLKVDDFDP